MGDLDLQNTSDCESHHGHKPQAGSRQKQGDVAAFWGPVRFLISLPASNFQPKIIWLKNQMEIREDPKYIALIDQGVCSLEIRKPGPFDGGVYTCKAVNALGEASVDCRLDVKGETGWGEGGAGAPLCLSQVSFSQCCGLSLIWVDPGEGA